MYCECGYAGLVYFLSTKATREQCHVLPFKVIVISLDSPLLTGFFFLDIDMGIPVQMGVILFFSMSWFTVVSTYGDLYGTIMEDTSWNEVQMVEHPILRYEAEVCLVQEIFCELKKPIWRY